MCIRDSLGRGCQTLSQVVVGRSVGVEGDHRGRDGSLDALALALGSPNDRAQVSQLLAHRAHPGVGFVQPLQSGLGALGRHSDLVANPSQPEPGLLDEGRRGGDSRARLLQSCFELQETGSPVVSADDEPRSEHIAGGRHRGDPLGDERPGRTGVGDQGHALQELVDGRSDGLGAVDDLHGPAGVSRERRSAVCPPGPRRGTDEHARPAVLPRAQRLDAGHGSVQGVDRDGVCCPTQGGGDRRLVPRGHLQQGRHRAEHPVTQSSVASAEQGLSLIHI